MGGSRTTWCSQKQTWVVCTANALESPGVAGDGLGFGNTRWHLNQRKGLFLQFLYLPKDRIQHRGAHPLQLLPSDRIHHIGAQPSSGFHCSATPQQGETPIPESQRALKSNPKLSAPGISVPQACLLAPFTLPPQGPAAPVPKPPSPSLPFTLCLAPMNTSW